MATAMPLDPALRVGDLSYVPHDISRCMKGHGWRRNRSRARSPEGPLQGTDLVGLARQATEGGRPRSHVRSHRERREDPGREPTGTKLGHTPWGSEPVIQSALELSQAGLYLIGKGQRASLPTRRLVVAMSSIFRRLVAGEKGMRSSVRRHDSPRGTDGCG